MRSQQPEANAKPAMGPLSGIRVIDVGWFIGGPVTATLLAEFGAEVIKVERPLLGDDLRRIGWMKGEASLWWAVEARNKRSITLNLSHPKGQAILARLVERADVMVENFRPGTLEKWGLSWETLSARNPRLILLRTSGFGQTGPYRSLAAFNGAVESLGGLRYLVGEPDRPPARPGIALGDYAGAMFGAIGVLIALYERDARGSNCGQWIDNALYEAVLRLTEYTIPAYQHTGRIRERIGAGAAGTAPARSFRCADGTWVSVSAANDKTFERLCRAIGRPELAADSRFSSNADRVKNVDELHGVIDDWCAERGSEEVLATLQESSVAAMPVYSAKDLVANPHIRNRRALVQVPDPILGETLMPGVTPRLARTPGDIRHAGPVLGSDNERIYGSELGMSSEDLGILRAEGVI